MLPFCLRNAVTLENKLSWFPRSVCSHAVSLDQVLQGRAAGSVLLSHGIPCAFRAVTPPPGCPHVGMCLCRPLSFTAGRGQAEGHSHRTLFSVPCARAALGDRNPWKLPGAAVARCPRSPPRFIRVVIPGTVAAVRGCAALSGGDSLSAAFIEE